MIKGTGIDIIEIDRIQSALEKYGDKFLNRIYTKSEIAYCHRRGKVGIPELAARFAAKEALSKALGVGIRSFGRPNFGISWKDVEIASNNRGKPYIIYKEVELKNSHLSLSHSRDFAVATVIIEE